MSLLGRDPAEFALVRFRLSVLDSCADWRMSGIECRACGKQMPVSWPAVAGAASRPKPRLCVRVNENGRDLPRTIAFIISTIARTISRQSQLVEAKGRPPVRQCE